MSKTRAQRAAEAAATATPRKITVRVGQKLQPRDKNRPMEMIAVSTPVSVDLRQRHDVIKSVSAGGQLCATGLSISLDDLEKQIVDLRAKYGAIYSNLQFMMENTCSCYYECACRPSLVLVGERDENPQEAADRATQEAYTAECERNRDQKLLHELANKLGKKVQ